MTGQFASFESKTENPHFEGVFDITPEEVAEKIQDVVLIDVREPDEYVGELGHIAGSQLVVLGTLPGHIAQIPKDKTVVFVCRSGGRSAQATAFALTKGYKEAFNMMGGMLQWNKLNLPVER